MNHFGSDDSLIDDDEVFGKTSDNPEGTGSDRSTESLNRYKPWHKPRKQFIRNKQWLFHLKRLVRTPYYKDIGVVNYFGLPGGDLLDVNYLQKNISGSASFGSKSLGVHGFVSPEVEYNQAEGFFSKLLDTDEVASSSKLENFNFEDLYNRDSAAWSRVKRFGVYHFINLDFCDSAMKDRCLGSIYQLLCYQMERVVGVPWLFCLTTRLNREGSTEDIIDRFDNILKEFMSNGEVLIKVQECFEDICEEIKSFDKIGKVENPKALNTLLQICLVLWVIKESHERGHQTELVSSFKYSVDLYNREQDMHSFVFRFFKKEKIQGDKLGILQVSESSEEPSSEYEQAKNAFEKLLGTLDVDQHLEENIDELKSSSDQTVELLSDCGYDTEDYYTFMRDNFGYRLP